jgi:hypothetical protein
MLNSVNYMLKTEMTSGKSYFRIDEKKIQIISRNLFNCIGGYYLHAGLLGGERR